MSVYRRHRLLTAFAAALALFARAGTAQESEVSDRQIPADEPLIVVITPTPTDEPVEDFRAGYVVREDGSIFALSDWILARLEDPGAIRPDGVTSLFPDRAPPIEEWAVSEVTVMIDGQARKMTVAAAAAAMGLDLSRRIPSTGDQRGVVNVALQPSDYNLGYFTLGTPNLSDRDPAARF